MIITHNKYIFYISKTIFLLFLLISPLNISYLEDLYPFSSQSSYENFFNDDNPFSFKFFTNWLYDNRVYFVLFFISVAFLVNCHYYMPSQILLSLPLSDDIDKLLLLLEYQIPFLDFLKLWAILHELDTIISSKSFVIKYLIHMLNYYNENENLCKDHSMVNQILVKLIIEISDQYLQFPILPETKPI
jgi:hypothetical protein